MTILKCINPEKLEDIIFAYGCSCNHRNLDDTICVVDFEEVSLKVGHIEYVCKFTSNEVMEVFLTSVVGAKIDVCYG